MADRKTLTPNIGIAEADRAAVAGGLIRLLASVADAPEQPPRALED